MLTNKRGQISNYIAEGAIAAHTLVTPGTHDDQVTTATATANAPSGVTTEVAATNAGRVDVVQTGITQVRYGATVIKGDLLTTDAQGRAVPVSAATDRVHGQAVIDGVPGDLGSIDLTAR